MTTTETSKAFPESMATTPSRTRKSAATGRKPSVRQPASDKQKREEVFEKKPDGTRLIRAINQRMAMLGMDPVQAAEAFDMSYSYFITLANNPSRFAFIDRRFMRNIARFLGITTIMAYQYSGFFEDEDITADVNVDKLLAKSRNNMEADPVYGFYVRSAEKWNELPIRDRMLFHFLYSDVEVMRAKILECQGLTDENLDLRNQFDQLQTKYVDLQAQLVSVRAEHSKLVKQVGKTRK